ncbi:TCP-1/cpn60 chaperonin family-domain-containing protein [Mycena latifolia]|nr:TCP-1/cpn60 chaperonin family-domain-containing protein [Mycena latifolia]
MLFSADARRGRPADLSVMGDASPVPLAPAPVSAAPDPEFESVDDFDMRAEGINNEMQVIHVHVPRKLDTPLELEAPVVDLDMLVDAELSADARTVSSPRDDALTLSVVPAQAGQRRPFARTDARLKRQRRGQQCAELAESCPARAKPQSKPKPRAEAKAKPESKRAPAEPVAKPAPAENPAPAPEAKSVHARVPSASASPRSTKTKPAAPAEKPAQSAKSKSTPEAGPESGEGALPPKPVKTEVDDNPNPRPADELDLGAEDNGMPVDALPNSDTNPLDPVVALPAQAPPPLSIPLDEATLHMPREEMHMRPPSPMCAVAKCLRSAMSAASAVSAISGVPEEAQAPMTRSRVESSDTLSVPRVPSSVRGRGAAGSVRGRGAGRGRGRVVSAAQARCPLVIIVEDVDGEALTTSLPSGRPASATTARAFLATSQYSPGTVVFTDELDIKLERATPDMLGTTGSITVTKEDTIVLNGEGPKDTVAARSQLQERLAKLSDGVAMIKVGGASEVEVGEKKDRYDDALNATRAAVEEGILPSSSGALLKASPVLATSSSGAASSTSSPTSPDATPIPTANLDQELGVAIMRRVLTAPARAILSNAGEEASVIVGTLLRQSGAADKFGWGYDTAKGEWGPSTKFVQTALVDAAGVANLLTTSECSLVDAPRRRRAARGDGRGYGRPEGTKPQRHRNRCARLQQRDKEITRY